MIMCIILTLLYNSQKNDTYRVHGATKLTEGHRQMLRVLSCNLHGDDWTRGQLIDHPWVLMYYPFIDLVMADAETNVTALD